MKRDRETGRRTDGEAKSWGNLFLVVMLAIMITACALKASRGGIPSEVDLVVSTFSDDMENGRYDKIYNEAAEQWRRDATVEQSNNALATLRAELGKVSGRSMHSATESHTSGLGHSFDISYETRFERGEGMETFTVIDQNGHWLLARYLVNSTALR